MRSRGVFLVESRGVFCREVFWIEQRGVFWAKFGEKNRGLLDENWRCYLGKEDGFDHMRSQKRMRERGLNCEVKMMLSGGKRGSIKKQ